MLRDATAVVREPRSGSMSVPRGGAGERTMRRGPLDAHENPLKAVRRQGPVGRVSDPAFPGPGVPLHNCLPAPRDAGARRPRRPAIAAMSRARDHGAASRAGRDRRAASAPEGRRPVTSIGIRWVRVRLAVPPVLRWERRAALVVGLLLLAGPAAGQEYPTRDIKAICNFTAGSGADVFV